MEKVIEAYLRDKVREAGGLCLKFVSPGCTGVPDRIILFPGGRVAFAETKDAGKTERPRQNCVQAMLCHLGFTVYNTVDSREKVRQIIADMTGGWSNGTA